MSALLVAGGPRVRTPSPNSSRGGEWFYERTDGGWRSSGPHPFSQLEPWWRVVL